MLEKQCTMQLETQATLQASLQFQQRIFQNLLPFYSQTPPKMIAPMTAAMTCGQCFAPISVGQKFCPNCGTRLQ